MILKSKKFYIGILLTLGAVYFLAPIGAGAVNYRLAYGPLIYWKEYHRFMHGLGYSLFSSSPDRPTGGGLLFYHRPWFYFMPIELKCHVDMITEQIPPKGSVKFKILIPPTLSGLSFVRTGFAIGVPWHSIESFVGKTVTYDIKDLTDHKDILQSTFLIEKNDSNILEYALQYEKLRNKFSKAQNASFDNQYWPIIINFSDENTKWHPLHLYQLNYELPTAINDAYLFAFWWDNEKDIQKLDSIIELKFIPDQLNQVENLQKIQVIE